MIKFNLKRTKKIVYLLLTLFILLEATLIVSGNTFFCMIIQATTPVSSPLVILQNVTNSFIYTNNTSARVTISNGTSSLNVLKILNQTSDDWKLQLIRYDDVNISRLTNCTIWFQDGIASVQIKIINGSYNQTSGSLYDFPIGNDTYITITASTNAISTSYIYTYLKILKSDTSTYFLYQITFEIT